MTAKLRALLCITGCMASGLSLSCKEEESEEFGYTCVELSRGNSVTSDPFVGTYDILVTLNYESCLVDYYTKKHPDQRLDGDLGPAVFEEWRTRLCTEEVPRRIECEIPPQDEMGFEQILQETDPKSYQLTIRYRTPDPGNLDGRILLWGPAPLTEYAECAEGLSSFVSLSNGIVGRDSDGKLLWHLQSFDNARGKIDSKGGGCIKAAIEPIT